METLDCSAIEVIHLKDFFFSRIALSALQPCNSFLSFISRDAGRNIKVHIAYNYLYAYANHSIWPARGGDWKIGVLLPEASHSAHSMRAQSTPPTHTPTLTHMHSLFPPLLHKIIHHERTIFSDLFKHDIHECMDNFLSIAYIKLSLLH